MTLEGEGMTSKGVTGEKHDAARGRAHNIIINMINPITNIIIYIIN